MMKKLWRNQDGMIAVVLIGFQLGLLLFVMLVLECGGMLYRQDYAEAILQRAANTAVESNMDDAFRADRILRLDAEQAKQDFMDYVEQDMTTPYTVTITSVSATEMPPSLTATGTITLQTMFTLFGHRELSYHFMIRATNYDMHGDTV